jgi:crotonobetaine/carnitine-CoA ligase
MLDEVPVAFVIPAPAASAAVRAGLAEAIGLACRDKLADFKRPRQVFVVEEMPRSTLEKVNKAELRKRLPPA